MENVPDEFDIPGPALVVEDHGLIAMEAEAILNDLGVAQVYLAVTCSEALRWIERQQIAFAVLDVDLNGESSAPVARRLVADGIPFVVATGYNSGDQHDDAFDAAPVVSKPYSQDDLARAIKRAVNPGQR